MNFGLAVTIKYNWKSSILLPIMLFVYLAKNFLGETLAGKEEDQSCSNRLGG